MRLKLLLDEAAQRGGTLSSFEAIPTCGCSSLQVTLKQADDWYTLLITPFSDEESARAFIPKVYGGLMWALLQKRISTEFVLKPQSVVYADDPEKAAQNLSKFFNLKLDRVDGLIDGGPPAIYQSDKQLRSLTINSSTVTVGYKAEDACAVLCEGIGMERADAVMLDGKLHVALDLYNAFFRESSYNAKFLTLAIALEALAPQELKTAEVVMLIEQWMSDLRTRKDSITEETDEWVALDALEKEIGYRKEVSIRKRVRSVVHDILSRNGDVDAQEIAKQAVLLYDKRSRLVHDGVLPEQELRQATNELERIVHRVLEARFLEVAKGVPVNGSSDGDYNA